MDLYCSSSCFVSTCASVAAFWGLRASHLPADQLSKRKTCLLTSLGLTPFPHDRSIVRAQGSVKNSQFLLWCWRRLLRVPWTARRSNQSILKEISPGCSWEGLMLKLKLQYFGHLMLRVDSLEKTLMLGGIGGRRRRG